MGLDDIIEKIEGDFESRAEEMVKKAKGEAESILSENKAHVAKELEAMVHENQKLAEQTRKQILSKAHIASKKLSLLAREEVVEECFAEIRTALEKLSGEKRKKLLKMFYTEGKSIIVAGTVNAASKDRKAVEELIGKGFDVGDDIEESIGGFTITDKSGKIKVDYTFEEILDRRSNAIRTLVVKELFGE